MASSMLRSAMALAGVMASSAAVAAQFDYSLYAGIEHTDNVNLSATDPISQNVFIPGLAFDYSQQGSTLQANLAGALEYRDYLGNTFGKQTLGQLSGQVNWTVIPQRLDFTVQEFAGVQPVSTLSSDSPNNQQQTNVLSLGPTLHFLLGDALRGQAELRYINSDASRTKTFNSSRGEAALRLIRDISPTDQLSLNIESQHVNFYDSSGNPNDMVDGITVDPNLLFDSALENPNYTRNEAFVHYLSKLTHFTVDASLGWSQIDFSKAGSVSNPLVRFTLGWQPTFRSSFSVSAAREYSDAAEDAMEPGAIVADANALPNSNPADPVGVETGNSVIDPQVYLDKRIEGTYAFTTERVRLTLSPMYGQRQYLSNPTFNQTDRGGSAGLDYHLNTRLTLQAFTDIDSVTYSALSRHDRTSDYSVGLVDQTTAHWGWRFSLTHRQRDSNVADQSYHDNEIYLGVIFRR
jgi:hypothetical protein